MRLEQSGGSGENYEVHDQGGEEHAECNIASGVAEFRLGGAHAIDQAAPTHGNIFFDVLIGLPGVKVGRKRCADDGEDHGQKFAVEMNGGYECAAQYWTQLRFRQQRGTEIGQQGQSEPAKDIPYQSVRTKDLEQQHGGGEADDDPLDRYGNDQVQSGGHAAQVGAGFNSVADDHPNECAVQQPAGIMLFDDGEQSLAGDLADFGREIYHREHHGIENRDHPQQRGAVLRAGAGVGSDGGGIVVGGACDQAEADGAEDTFVDRPRSVRLIASFEGGIMPATLGKLIWLCGHSQFPCSGSLKREIVVCTTG